MSPSLLAIALLCQDPQTAPAPIGAAAATTLRADVVELKGGELLEGRIVLERGNYFEIELAPGSTIGFRTTDVVAVRKGAGAALATAKGLTPREQWFVLHDGAGQPVGWLHSSVTNGEDGTGRLLEEWEFNQGQRHFQVTALETVDPELRPLSCYFRERIREEQFGHSPVDPMGRSERVLQERIVEGRVEAGVLRVERLTADGRRDRLLPWTDGTTFPLLARLRQAGHPAGGGSPAGETVTVFDPALEELAARVFAPPRPRTVTIDGKPVQVVEQLEDSAAGANAMWLDATARVLRREIAGPSLVAVPNTADGARSAVSRGTALPALFVAEAGGRFGVWRPNPAWEAVPIPAGTVALRCALHDATISLSILDHLDKGAAVTTAADAVERWLHLLAPGSTIDRRDWTKVRGHDAVRLQATTTVAGKKERQQLCVVPWQEVFLVLRCTAATGAFAELEHDFDAVLAHVELDPRAVGLLLPKTADGKPATPAVAPAAEPSVAAPSPAPRPRVRVPLDDQR